MAKVNAPLFSFGASGKLGNALVYFNWKGINAIRTWVAPSNPQSTSQTTHRGYLADAVAAIHAAQALGTDPFAEDDKSAYALWGTCYPTPRTWFNQICKNWIDQRVAGLRSAIYRAIAVTPGDGQVAITVDFTEDGGNNITAGDFFYGTSKTALVNSDSATVAADNAAKTITGLTNGVKYYFQFRPSAHADFVGAYSGIIHSTPSA